MHLVGGSRVSNGMGSLHDQIPKWKQGAGWVSYIGHCRGCERGTSRGCCRFSCRGYCRRSYHGCRRCFRGTFLHLMSGSRVPNEMGPLRDQSTKWEQGARRVSYRGYCRGSCLGSCRGCCCGTRRLVVSLTAGFVPDIVVGFSAGFVLPWVLPRVLPRALPRVFPWAFPWVVPGVLRWGLPPRDSPWGVPWTLPRSLPWNVMVSPTAIATGTTVGRPAADGNTWTLPRHSAGTATKKSNYA